MTKSLYKPSLSVVIPVKDEDQSLAILTEELTEVLKKLQTSYEIIFIDDGSTDTSYETLSALQKKLSHIVIIKFRANFGKSAALSAGFRNAHGDIIITLDADLQDDPHEIPLLLDKLQQGFDLVVGWRQKRNDSLYKKMSSKLFNIGTRLITGARIHDFNSGLKILKADAARKLNLHGELHRFIPILAIRMQFRVAEVAINHRSRRFGKSKYGAERGWRGVIDLLTIVFITDYAGKPAHFFGKIGLMLSFIGLALTGYVTYIRITTGNVGHHLPLLLGGALFLMLGVQLFSTGLIAELITYYNKDIASYEEDSVSYNSSH